LNVEEDGDKWVSFSDIKLLGRSLAGVRERRANGNYPAATASKVSVSKKPSNILSCVCGWAILSLKVIGELFGDFIIVADAALDKPGAC
jgi:hypothetical protein